MKSKIFAAVCCALISTSAFADKGKGNGGNDDVNPAGCPVVGIKATGVYLTASQRACFANVKKAGRKGYEAAASDSVYRAFSFDLTGAEEVPTVTTTATGNCTVALLADTTTVRVMCVHTVVSPTMAHIHTGAIGVEGDVICDLGNGASPINTTCTLTDEQKANLLNGDLYVNVHSGVNTGGELRGQID